jgi:YD repeat-containing protein
LCFTSKIDANGNTTGITYDGRGRITEVENPDGSVATYVYDTVDDDDVITSTVVYTNENGGRLRYEYNPAGQLTAIYDIDAGVQLLEKKYDIHMRLYLFQ